MENYKLVNAPEDVKEQFISLVEQPLEDIADRIEFKLEHISRKDIGPNNVAAEHVSFNDLINVPLPRDITARAVIRIDEEMSAVMSNSLIEHYLSTDRETIYDICMSNLLQEHSKLVNLGDMIEHLLPDNELYYLDDPATKSMYVLSNENNTFGARMLLRKDILRLISKDIGESYFILPSSIHELILVFDDRIDGDGLLDLVKAVNNTELDIRDKLSDSVMHYDAEDGFEVVRQAR